MLIYREEIDGLRSIAVIPVILYHAGLRMFFAGGYVGVDIFFVISGYLITSLIENECHEGNFSLINFYERRCRRILPALFLILFLSSLFAYYLMSAEQLKEFGETLISIICFNSNIYFWWKDDGYFSQISQLNPLIHTWSLAVEEQFYLIFPLLYYLLYKKRLYLIILLISLATISLFLCQWGGNLESMSTKQFHNLAQHRYASFYLPTGRIWELLLGTFAAFYLRMNDSSKKFSHKCNQLFSLFGFVLIIISVVFLDSRIIPPFPNFYTLVPTCGATLIILFGEKNTFVGYLLSTRLLRWIGLISYSAYLWHQPLLVFIRLQSNGTSQMLPIIIVVSAVFPLSVLSYFFIEQPFRNKKLFSQKMIFLIAGLCTLITLIIALFLIKTADNQLLLLTRTDNQLLLLNRTDSQLLLLNKTDDQLLLLNKTDDQLLLPNKIDDQLLLLNRRDDPYITHFSGFKNWKYTVRNFNRIEGKNKFSNTDPTFNRRIALIGDSFTQDFYNMIIEGKHLTNYEICIYFVHTHCQIYLGEEDRMKFIYAPHRYRCINSNDIKYALPMIRQANIIVLSSQWQQWSAERLPNTIRLLNLTKQQQLFVFGRKDFGKVDPMTYKNTTRLFRIQQFQYPRPEAVQVNRLLEKTLDKSIYVDITKMICTGFNQTCALFTPDAKLITYDGEHLTEYGAYHIGNIIFKNKPFNKLK